MKYLLSVYMHATVEPPYSSRCIQPTDIQTQLHDQVPCSAIHLICKAATCLLHVAIQILAHIQQKL